MLRDIRKEKHDGPCSFVRSVAVMLILAGTVGLFSSAFIYAGFAFAIFAWSQLLIPFGLGAVAGFVWALYELRKSGAQVSLDVIKNVAGAIVAGGVLAAFGWFGLTSVAMLFANPSPLRYYFAD